MQHLPEALAPLAAYNQFILYNNKKHPIDYRTGVAGDAHDPSCWMDAQTAIDTANLYGDEYGVGFVFTKNDPFFFVDLDKCLEPDDTTWSPVAMDILNRLPGAAVEISQSGRGLHIFGKGIAPDHSCKNITLGLEFYTDGRYVALTGNGAMGSADLDCSALLPSLVNAYFQPKTATKDQTWTTEPVAEWNGIKDDDKLIAKALAAKSASSIFSDKSTFAGLWTGDETELANAYAADGRTYDGSSADAALAQHLAFWTGNDCERILRLMWKSGLVRDKWNRPDYLIRTITRAVSMQTKVYTAGKRKEPQRVAVEPAAAPLANPEIMDCYQFLGATQQIEHFTGCVYIQDMHRVFTPSGTLLKSEQFNATYGGYVFQLDSDASGKTTRKAFEAFTESQAVRYPQAESMTFRPDLISGSLINEDGRILVNTYVTIETPRIKGDPTRFLIHLAKILPDERDRTILLSYMAACIQYKGVKFQWAPLVQGAPGNGKTLFTRCVAFAIGKRYTHMPKADDIDNKFNGWMLNKLFIGIEDIFVPTHKQEVLQALLPMITNDELEIQLKGTDQVTRSVCANFLMNCNDKAAIRKTRNDRRFCMFFTAQQSIDDIERDGMGGDYFPELYNWLRGDGYAIVADYLASYQIPDELNPATSCHRAPETSSTNEAVAASLGGIEQEIMEAIDEGRPGFAGGWVSSMAVDKLLDSMRLSRAIPHNKRRDLMKTLGYDWHPHLHNGRVNNAILMEGGKPRLFIKNGHIASNVESPAEIARMYQEAQGMIAATTTGAGTYAGKM